MRESYERAFFGARSWIEIESRYSLAKFERMALK